MFLKILQNSKEKEKKATDGKKNNNIRRKNLDTTYIRTPYRFIIQTFLYSSFLCVPRHIENTSF